MVRAVTSPKYSVIRGEDSKNTTAGKLSTFEVVARDQGGNRRRKGGDHLKVTFAGSAKVEVYKIIDNNSGLYIVNYQATHSGWLVHPL